MKRAKCIYSATMEDRLDDVIRCCCTAKILRYSLIKDGQPYERLQPGEMAVGNWIIRPRFPEPSPDLF